MCFEITNITLPEMYSGDTFDGLTWTVSDVSDDNTSFSGTLTRAVFQITNSTGDAIVVLDSENAGQVTLNQTAPNSWSFTVEPIIISAESGTNSWAVRLYDDSSSPERVKVTIAGTIKIKKNPIS